MKKHIVELLVEANKKISDVINAVESDNSNDSSIIDNVNDVIRRLDHIVEQLESK